MWCLPTIIALNEKLSQGASLDDAYSQCGIGPLAASREPAAPAPEDSARLSEGEVAA